MLKIISYICFLVIGIMSPCVIKANPLAETLTPIINFDHKSLQLNIENRVILEGYLFIDREVYLFSSLDSLNKFTSVDRVTIKANDEIELSNFNGCFVSVKGTLKLYTGNVSRYFLEDVDSVKRRGLFYDLALRQQPDKPPKCLVKAIIDVL